MKEAQLRDGAWVCMCLAKERTSHPSLRDHYRYIHNVDLLSGKKIDSKGP